MGLHDSCFWVQPVLIPNPASRSLDAARHLLAVAVCVLALDLPGAHAQVPVQPTPTPQPAGPTDALGRDTPVGTVTGFGRAVHRDDFVTAARYLQLRGRQTANVERLARDLNTLLDRYYTKPLAWLSSSPAGKQADGLVPNREQIPLQIGSETYELLLERVTDPDAGPIWLFSSESIADVPRLTSSAEKTWIERSLPAALVGRRMLGASLAQWVAWAASLTLPVLLLWFLGGLVVRLAGWMTTDSARRILFRSWWLRLRWPLVIVVALAVHVILMTDLGFSLQVRYVYSRITVAVMIVVGAVLCWRLITLSFNHVGILALRRGHADTRSLLLLAARVAKVVVALVALFGLLSVAGLDLTTALAGVGIVGVAVAFGAQKTVENLLGGVFLLTDRVIAVGDYCRLSDREGWIEDITLRSVRLRTLQQTLLSVPAGVLAQGNIENYSTRGKILIQSRLRLRYGASVDQLQQVLAGIRKVVAADESLEHEGARVRLVDFSAEAVEIELFAFVKTGDPLRYFEVREDVLLRVAAVVESAECAFAAPPQFLYSGVSGSDESTPAVVTNYPPVPGLHPGTSRRSS